MTRISPTTPLKSINSFFSGAIVFALIASIIFGAVAGQVSGDEAYSWGWFFGGFALSGLAFLPVVMGFEALRRVGHNQEILGAKLDAIHDEGVK
jgi:hypothetical protein